MNQKHAKLNPDLCSVQGRFVSEAHSLNAMVMRSLFAISATLLLVLCVGCNRPLPTKKAVSESAAEIAQQLRGEITQPSMMQLESRDSIESSPRESRQREIGLPFMQKLISLGNVAEPEIWKLINDEDASVRRSCAGLIQKCRTDAMGLPLNDRVLESLHIPIMERMLESSDDQVRYIACDSLGNLATFSVDLDRLLASLEKLRKLKSDESPTVRSLAWIASNNISAALSKNAKSVEDRDAAAEIWMQLQAEGKW